MENSAIIRRDKNGIPHIEAPDRPALYRAQGYVHAKDRGIQLLLMRILGQGRLSEYLDSSEESLAIDTFFRRMNWGHIGESSLTEMSAETKTCLASYTDGVNDALAEGIPWEFKLMGYKPEPWHMNDSLMMSRMLGYLTLAQSQGEIERLLVELVQGGGGVHELGNVVNKLLVLALQPLLRQLQALGHLSPAVRKLFHLLTPLALGVGEVKL